MTIEKLTEIYKKQRHFSYKNKQVYEVAKINKSQLLGNQTLTELQISFLLRKLCEKVVPQYIILINTKFVIADFYLPERHLLIELDGNQHYTEEGILKDQNREKELSTLGYTNVLRLKNAQAETLNLIDLQNLLKKYPVIHQLNDSFLSDLKLLE
jgi:very-short-patch-repair endonuclease